MLCTMEVGKVKDTSQRCIGRISDRSVLELKQSGRFRQGRVRKYQLVITWQIASFSA